MVSCNAKKIVTINLSMWICLVIFIHVTITDNIIYFTGLCYISANIIALVIGILINLILLHKRKSVHIINQYSKWDFLFYGILIITCVLTIGFADRLWDTHSYHIYLQENPFKDKIYDDFFPGRTLTSFVYPIADRVFYMFRYVGGFRLGTLPSYLIMIPVFYGIKKTLKFLVPDINAKFLSVTSIVPICTFILLQQMGTYYIDNFSVLFLLEFTYIALAYRDMFLDNKKYIYYTAIICGVAVCIKFTNAIFIIGILLYVMLNNIKNIRNIKIFDYVFLIVIFILPMFPYFIDSIYQTGSPTFPYYNKIFCSKFFVNENWLDRRFGPDNILQFIFWPIYIIFNPSEAYDLELGLTDFAFASGYIIALIYFCIEIKGIIKKTKKCDRKKSVLSLILLYYYLVWEKLAIGYTRYAGIIPVLSTIFIIYLLWEGLVKKIKWRNALCLISICISLVVAVIGYCGFCAPRYYACYFIPSIAGLFGEDNAALKIQHAFNMFGKDRENLSYDINGIWGVIGDDSMAPQFLATDDKIVHLEYGIKIGETEVSQQLYWDNVLNNKIYVPIYGDKLNEKLELLDEFHFELIDISDIIYNVTFIQGEQTIWIVEVQYNQSHYNGNQEQFQIMRMKKE